MPDFFYGLETPEWNITGSRRKNPEKIVSLCIILLHSRGLDLFSYQTSNSREFLLLRPFPALSITAFMCQWMFRPEEPTNLKLSVSALMHGFACDRASLKKPTHVPVEAWDVLFLFAVCPCGMNKRCASWWAEQCQWRNQRKWFKKM